MILGLVAAGAGGLAVLERDVLAPAPSSVTVALPERPESVAPAQADEPAAPDVVVAVEVAEPPPPPASEAEIPAVEPVPAPAPVPGLVLAFGGLAWNEALADVAHRAMPAEVGFAVRVDHPALSEIIGGWRTIGRDVLLLAASDADVEALLAAHPGAAAVVLEDRRFEPRRGPDDLPARSLDASLMDYPGFAAALREITAAARDLPPPVVVIELYPGLVPQLQAWLDQLNGAGYRLWRPLELGEAMGE